MSQDTSFAAFGGWDHLASSRTFQSPMSQDNDSAEGELETEVELLLPA